MYDRNELYTICADKYKVREFIKRKLNEKYLIPLLYSSTDIEEIPFETLPVQYIIKTNHGSGGNIVVVGDKMFFKEKWQKLDYLFIKKIIKNG